jgi:hypothetical protein
MSLSDELLGWRDRAIAFAALGSAALGRAAFAQLDDDQPEPLAMQILVCMHVGESLRADPPNRVTASWLSQALRIEENVVRQLVRELVDQGHVSYLPYAGEDEDEDEELALTDRGVETVARWLDRVRNQFQGWPTARPDVDDVTT